MPGPRLAFDKQVAWLATQCSKSAITELMRIAWGTVGAIITRVWADVEHLKDRFAGLRRIGYRRDFYKRHQLTRSFPLLRWVEPRLPQADPIIGVGIGIAIRHR